MQTAEFLIPPSAGSLVSVEEVVTRSQSKRRGHRHHGAHVCVVLDGSFEEQDATGRVRQCEAGAVRVSPSGSEHRIRFGSNGARCLVFVMPETASHIDRWFPSPGTPDVFRNEPTISALAERARTEARSDGIDAALVVEGLLAEIVARAKVTKTHAPPAWLTRSRRRIDASFRKPVSLARLAEESGVHRAHFTRAFARYYGRSARDHLRALRLAYAARRLAEADLPIAQVAFESGFFDQSHLTTAFKARFGRPPGAFRRAVDCG